MNLLDLYELGNFPRPLNFNITNYNVYLGLFYLCCLLINQGWQITETICT